MVFPNEKELEDKRKVGLRPTVVACCIFEGKILEIHVGGSGQEWAFIQGGIEVNESIVDALKREIQEECGTNEFIDWSLEPELVYTADVILTSQRATSRTFSLTTGEIVRIKGKSYYFMLIHAKSEIFPLNSSQFVVFRWENYRSAIEFVHQLKNMDRRKIYLHLINILHNRGELR